MAGSLLAVGTTFEALRLHCGRAEVAFSDCHGGGAEVSLVMDKEDKFYQVYTEIHT